MGRKRLEKYGPRPIDIDIIFADDLIISDQELVIPHPRMQYRRFVLVPASEIAPDWKHPVSGKKISQLLTECSDDLTVALKRPLFNAE